MNDPAPKPDRPALRHAATVILLRESAAGAEVLVTQRHENLAFMGGMWVFPGGVLSPADMTADALALIPPLARERCARFTSLQGSALTPEECMGLAVAAYRETFEETGVLLATTADGMHCGDDLWNRLQSQRRAVAATPALFIELLRTEQLHLDIERLVYWAHWITPSNAPRRFDTRFFLAAAPASQTACIDTIEAVDHAWLTPRAILEAAERGSMPVSQPTMYNLMELDASLRAHSSLAAMLEAERTRPIAPILPKVRRDDGLLIVLPWDAEYASMPGEGAPSGLEYPARLRALPSRLQGK